MYYKRLLTLCGLVQLCSGILALLLFLVEWKVFGLLIPIYAVGVVQLFCGAWCLVEIYRRATITAAAYTSGCCISAASMAVSITMIAAASVDLKDYQGIAVFYRRPVTDALLNDVDHVQVLVWFGFTFLIVGLVAVGAAFIQFITCIIRLVRNQDNITLPTRILENRLNNNLASQNAYVKMRDDVEDDTTV